MGHQHPLLSRVGLLALAGALLCYGAAGAGRSAQDAREPIGPRQFYPRSTSTLKAAIQAMVAGAVTPRAARPAAIVVPHAGYVYSGQIAADAYRQAAAHRYDTVVIVGTNHTDGVFRKVAIAPGRVFRTPLGGAPIDEAFVAALQKEDSDCVIEAGPHRAEHSVEVQVPFVQQLFPAAKIVPLVVGRPDQAMCVRLGRALAALSKDRSVLLVASSDLSHYPKAEDAGREDRATLELVANLDVGGLYQRELGESATRTPGLDTHACGAGAIMAVMTAARALGASHGTVVSYANSGETSVGEPSRTVGYGAVVFTSGERGADIEALKAPARDAGALQPGDKKTLLAFARETIRRYLATETLPLPRGFSPRVQKNRGVFVTLNMHRELRGCIGHIPSDLPLPRLVGAMALAAAFGDPRFSRVTLDELRDIEIEISILSPPARVGGPSDIVVGRDGVVIAADGRGAVFLPQVAPQQGWTRDQMLDNLCVKAGLPAGRWRRPGMTFETFQAEVFHEGEFK
jgi:hypothetical protein